MEKEENGKQSGRTDELMEKLREQGVQIIEAVADNDDEMCALVIIGTKDRTISMVHSSPSDRIVLAMANAAASDRFLICAMDIAARTASSHISSRGGTTVGAGDAEKK